MKVDVEVIKDKETILSFSVEAFAYEIADVRQKIAGAIAVQIKELNN